jgi:hypothetical protein
VDRRSEKLRRHAIFVGHALAANLGPEIVAASSRDDREALSRKFDDWRQFELRGAELVERSLRFNGQKLVDDAVHCGEGQPAGRKIHLPSGRDDIRLLANMQYERFAVGRDDGLKQ